ncbi:MAG: anti-sigma-factor antagonist [Actinomycetia bacterium]|nr:anti-sigma-factor antagonist [Actinomycetes bacterium]
MTVRAGRFTGGKAAPYGGIGAMGAMGADLAHAYDGMQEGQLQLLYQRTADGQAMVNVRGELDIATAERAHVYLRAVLDSDKKGKVILNLADLTFCDAAGLGVLAKVASHARRTGRSVRLTSPRPALIRIMRITGMDAVFPEVCTPTLRMVPGPRQSVSTAD